MIPVADIPPAEYVAEVARATRSIWTVTADALVERSHPAGIRRRTALDFIAVVRRPFPFFSEERMQAPLSPDETPSEWEDALRELSQSASFVADFLAFLKGTAAHLVVAEIGLAHPELTEEAEGALVSLTNDVARKATALVEWMERIEDHTDTLSALESLEDVQSGGTVSADDLRRELGL